MKQKKAKSTLLADNIQGLRTTKQTKPGPGGGGDIGQKKPKMVKRRKF